MKFKVKVPKTKNYFNVIIEKDVETMLKAKKKFKGLDKGDENAVAFICPFEKFNVSKKTGEQLKAPLIGHIYLNKANLGMGAISAMVLHASIHADRTLFGNKRAMFGMKISDKEARLVTVNGEMLESLTTQMKNAGL